jgi:hypothetical protein
MEETGGDDAETGFATPLIKRADRNVAGEIAAQGGEFIVHPKREFVSISPKKEGAKNKDAVT